MAAGGGDFCYEDKRLDDKIDNDGDYEDDYDEKEVDTTRPFLLYAASTPHQVGEQYEMQTMQHEQSGLPTYDERTPFLGTSDPETDELYRRLEALRENPITGVVDITEVDTSVNPLSEEDKRIQIERVKYLIRKKYPRVDFAKLGAIGFSKKNNDYCSL